MRDHEPDAVIGWLLKEGEPALRLRVLRELLDVADDSQQVGEARLALFQSPSVRGILERMHPDGYWLQRNPRKDAWVGDGVVYGSFASTHFCLAYLSELGLDRTNPQVSQAAERYLGLQQPDGDWLGHYSCLLGYNIRTFVRLGYRDDERVQRAVDLMLRTVRQDGGYLCDFHEGKYKNRSVKSCIRGSVKCLLAFMELPEYWEHPRCKALVDYFLSRGGIYQSKHPETLVNKDMERFAFPITWRSNTWEVLLALSKMGYGLDKRLDNAWQALETNADGAGRYHLDWTPTECPWKVGARGAANPWVTFYVLLAEKYRVAARVALPVSQLGKA